jgi:predicted ATPase
MDSNSGKAGSYRERADRFRAEAEWHGRRARALSNGRAAVFLLLVALLVRVEVAGLGPVVAGAVAATAAAFAVLVVLHARARRRERRFVELRRVNEEWDDRVHRRWERLPPHPRVVVPERHAYAEDLDIFGRASLYQLLGAPATPPGRTVLEGWLLAPSEPERVAERQQAVRELARHVELREALTLDGRRLVSSSERDIREFLGWAESEPWLTRRRAVVWAARVIPAMTAALAMLQLAGIISVSAWALPVLVGLVLTGTFGGRIRATFARAAAERGGIGKYSALLARVSEARFEAAALQRLQAELTANGMQPRALLRRVERLLDLADLRFNGMFYLPIQLFTLWDFHVLARLEAWQRVAGPHVRRWLEAYGEIEALATLARLAHDNPDWAFPAFDTAGPPRLEARALAHPLLPAGTRVANDVTVGPPGTFLLVTGSNMSGKSTLLRAIGTNVVLAQAGAPVCAREMRLPPVRLETSMRVRDSLERGVSHFMAELERLREIVDAAREARRQGRTLLYLLDELLQGTNTAERQIAARTILGHLLEQGAIGTTATHDLALADCDELRAAACAVHFRETIHASGDGPGMSFDYRLRPGLATSTNALRLIELVGLGRQAREAASDLAVPSRAE